MSVRKYTLAASAVLVAAAAGCSSGGGSASSGGGGNSMPVVTGLETKNVVVSDFPAIDSSGLFIAVNEGLFKKEGLNVTVIPDFKSSQDTVDQIQSGKAQVSSGDYVTYMNNFVAQNPDLEIVAEGSVLAPNVLALMTGPSGKVNSLQQIKGTSVPISGPNDIGSLLIDSLLADNGIPVGSVRYVPYQKLPAVPQYVAQKKFVAGPVPEPFVSQGEQLFGDKVLADLDQGAVSSFPIQGYAVTPQWAKQNPNTLKAFVTALDEGQEIADTNRAAVEKAVEQRPLGVPPLAAADMSLPNFPVGINPTRIQRVMTDMIQFKFFSGAQLAKARQFDAKNVVYGSNIVNGNGTSSLLGG